MSKNKVSYRPCWESNYSWIKKDKNAGQAYCSICKTSFRIDNSGLSQVKSHAKSAGHTAKEQLLEGKTNQRVLVSASNNTVSLSSSTITFSFEEQVLRAETIQALDCVYSNYSFSSTNNDRDKFKAMFPDSKIAESFKQGETKTKYVIVHGIAPYI